MRVRDLEEGIQHVGGPVEIGEDRSSCYLCEIDQVLGLRRLREAVSVERCHALKRHEEDRGKSRTTTTRARALTNKSCCWAGWVGFKHSRVARTLRGPR